MALIYQSCNTVTFAASASRVRVIYMAKMMLRSQSGETPLLHACDIHRNSNMKKKKNRMYIWYCSLLIFGNILL